MSNREPTRSLYQKSFQKECRAFVTYAEAISECARTHPNNNAPDPNSKVSRGLMNLLSKIARVKDTGLEMVAETPRCSLVRRQRSY
ncbi:hypothetical protein PDIG_24600 [Penicillium digitatum PHI26]|uniref:Uncharacterized protein n=2 Tax=Penicillium digitatum TaxID=36651 RepID=K9GRB3_PEND2|nr:hypothetical protein PDIP_59080 [Penicillium digitatum Pd1]EKV10633.1 hypothetical protein PDIP_59080 [Penicillium digitatum Pd1]EKV15671.1 hypothetical protein PDIG_24600 [Penicillium digitatum PHI26]